MMNESAFEKLTNEFTSLGELIRARQDEKQTIMDEFDRERGRYKQGRISENTLASSTRKTNKELIRLDKNIRLVIQKAVLFSKKSNDFVSKQKPNVFRAHESGIKLATKRKGVVKKKTVRKKVITSKKQLAKELNIDEKFSK